MMIKKQRSFFRIAGFLLTCSLASQIYAANIKPVNPEDPYEPFNRVMFVFNERADQFIFKPIATLYNKIMPKPVTKCISHFFSNLDTVPTVANDVLQGNIYQATSDAWRLAINTTVGVVGLFDVASHMGLEPNTEDLGLTFAQWGFKKSNYLVLPFIGSSTVRDSMAWPINYEFLTVYPYINPTRVRYGLYGLGLVSKRANYLHYQHVMQQASIDKYVFMRNAYMQRRAYLVERNQQLGDPYLEEKTVDEKNTTPLSHSS